MDTVYIYALCEPDTGEARYIGQTRNVERRLESHLSGSSGWGLHIWLSGLVVSGVMPIIRVIESLPGGVDFYARERYWIQRYVAEGAMLVNQINNARWSEVRASLELDYDNRTSAWWEQFYQWREKVAKRAAAG